MYCITLFYVIVISVFAIDKTSGDEENTVFSFKDEDGVEHVIDTEAEPMPLSVIGSATFIDYLLYTRRNPNDSQTLINGDAASITNSNFNPDLITVVITPGYLSSSNSKINAAIREPLLEVSDVNVIFVDWAPVSIFDYVTASAAVPGIGSNLGQFLAYLVESTSASYSNIHLVGHSLGAHISGIAGGILGGNIPRITGLDPAGPLWDNSAVKLNTTNAKYVEVIHTDAPGFGIRKPLGHVDFYPNGGATQPGCILDLPPCSHSRSWRLFGASIKYVFTGFQCPSIEDVDSNLCDGPTMIMGNNDLTKTGSGIYRLETTSDYPYQ